MVKITKSVKAEVMKPMKKEKPMEKNMKSMAASFETFCKKEGYHFQREDRKDDILYRMNFSLENAVGSVHNKIFFEDDCVTTIGNIDINAGKRKNEVAEFLMRLNDDEYLGHTQLDIDSGVIYYQVRRGYEYFAEADDFYVLNHCTSYRFDMYGDSLMKVILGVMSPKDAYDEVQKRMAEDRANEAESDEDSENK